MVNIIISEKRLKNVYNQISYIDIVFSVLGVWKREKQGRFSIQLFGIFVNTFELKLVEKSS